MRTGFWGIEIFRVELRENNIEALIITYIILGGSLL